MNEELLKERRVLLGIIAAARESIKDSLEKFLDRVKEFGEIAYDDCADEICNLMLSILRRSMRFVEYRSKIKIITKGNSISQKEIDRCDFVVRFSTKNSLMILKNSLNGVQGRFNLEGQVNV